jgi:hypothetical protein
MPGVDAGDGVGDAGVAIKSNPFLVEEGVPILPSLFHSEWTKQIPGGDMEERGCAVT